MRVQSKHLKHKRNIPSRCWLSSDFLAIDQNSARSRQFQPGDHTQGGSLATAGRAEQADELAIVYHKAGIAHGEEITEAFLHMLHYDLSHVSQEIWKQ
jgi:hypothetical protein